MKKLIMAALVAWSVAGMANAGIIKKPKKAKATMQKEQCCDKSKQNPNCCPQGSCCN